MPRARPGSPPEQIAAMMLELQSLGCHNINFVTPEHVVPQILEALARIDHRFGNEGDFGRPERFSESFAIDPVQVE